MSSTILHRSIEDFRSGNELDGAEAETFLDALISEAGEELIARVLTAWHHKGIEETEIYAVAKIMRERMTRVDSQHEIFVDIVGTGGSRSKTFNVSTAAAFVVAGAGIPVAKHGNKAATGNSGSADVLSELGIDPAVDAATAERCINEIGICFMFAPNFHRLSPVLAKVRRELGFPTIFNCVGPLCNPASAPHQLIGVWSEDLVSKMANALARLGTNKSWIVNGNGGLDEISLSGPTVVAEIYNGSVSHLEVSPDNFGIETSDMSNVSASNCTESAALIRDVLSGRCENKTAVDLVAVNAAATINIASPQSDLKTALARAKESIASGAALGKMEKLIDFTNK
ncbi:MAG TPA: anthranilate phosphoribosyltransferase [Pyrinomonadaceae bacterium]|nr:anthranilate phosphoribosyltransferase [Pyrinomonadaceae bacterium]